MVRLKMNRVEVSALSFFFKINFIKMLFIENYVPTYVRVESTVRMPVQSTRFKSDLLSIDDSEKLLFTNEALNLYKKKLS